MDRRFSGPNVLKAISDLFGGGYGTDGARRQADALLRDFAKADCVVPVSFELLRLHLSQAQRLPEEALQLLATGCWRRAQRRGVSEVSTADILGLATAMTSTKTVDSLVRMVAAKWLHDAVAGTSIPLENLLKEMQSERSELALLTLAALPEEANAKEVKIEGKRPAILLELQVAAPEVLRHLSLAGERSILAATQWLCVCDSSACSLEEVNSALLPTAGSLLQREDSKLSGLAAEFLESLMEKSGSCSRCPERLVQNLMVLLAQLQPSGEEARRRLCRLVAVAAGAWQRFFVLPATAGPPKELWVSLLEALMACAKWGHQLAAMTLPTWLALHSQALKAGMEVFEVYVPVLLKAARNLRDASIFPIDFHHWPPEDTESFVQFRRELRDYLRELGAEKGQQAAHAGSPKARQRAAQPGLLLPPLVEEIHADVVRRFNEDWRFLEEALHALSSLAKEYLSRKV